MLFLLIFKMPPRSGQVLRLDDSGQGKPRLLMPVWSLWWSYSRGSLLSQAAALSFDPGRERAGSMELHLRKPRGSVGDRRQKTPIPIHHYPDRKRPSGQNCSLPKSSGGVLKSAWFPLPVSHLAQIYLHRIGRIGMRRSLVPVQLQMRSILHGPAITGRPTRHGTILFTNARQQRNTTVWKMQENL